MGSGRMPRLAQSSMVDSEAPKNNASSAFEASWTIRPLTMAARAAKGKAPDNCASARSARCVARNASISRTRTVVSSSRIRARACSIAVGKLPPHATTSSLPPAGAGASSAEFGIGPRTESKSATGVLVLAIMLQSNRKPGPYWADLATPGTFTVGLSAMRAWRWCQTGTQTSQGGCRRQAP